MNSELLTGVVGLFGPTNVGKSTLLNRILGHKVAITSYKPQTTRKKIMGVFRSEDMEILFLDTPGLHKPKHELGRLMVASAKGAPREVDIMLLVLSFEDPGPKGKEDIFQIVKAHNIPWILAINKMDLTDPVRIQEILKTYESLNLFSSVVPISAIKGPITPLLQKIRPYLKPGPRFSDDESISLQPLEEWVAELIREKLYMFLRQELPYSCAVTIEEIKENTSKDMLIIQAYIYVETKSQKAIVIGEKGSMIKKIGSAAREELEKALKKKLYLELFVKVLKNWTKDPKALMKLGLYNP